MADIINSVHHEIFQKDGNKILYTQDTGKYIAFIAHITEVFDHLSEDEKLIVTQAVNKINEIQDHLDSNNKRNTYNKRLDI